MTCATSYIYLQCRQHHLLTACIKLLFSELSEYLRIVTPWYCGLIFLPTSTDLEKSFVVNRIYLKHPLKITACFSDSYWKFTKQNIFIIIC